MSFKSLDFLIFFPLVVILYFMLPHRHRWIWLLLASYYFYLCWKPVYVLLLMFSTVVDYTAGILMGRAADKKKRLPYLLLSLCSNLGMLFFFKYYNFFASTAQMFKGSWNIFNHLPELNLLLPVGISFYVFQSLSYTIDVYKGVRPAEKHFGIFALFIVFFPQLVAGPIERSTRLLPQFKLEHSFDYDRIASGLKLMAWGFFKKIVIADRLAIYVNDIYNAPAAHTGMEFFLATVFFAYQIYCDFSGYSDIAIGAARVLGFDLMQNFRTPYWSASIGEFWQRWHISLSTWFRDYVYIPLGGNRVSRWRWRANIIITFLLSGLWHGASWNFLIWGALHGTYMVLGEWTASWRTTITQRAGVARFPRLHHALKVGITFALVCLGWVFFRANSLSDAGLIINTLGELFYSILFRFHELGQGNHLIGLYQLKQQASTILINLFWIIFLECAYLFDVKESFASWLNKQQWSLRWGFYYALILVIVLCGCFEESRFIYFQF